MFPPTQITLATEQPLSSTYGLGRREQGSCSAQVRGHFLNAVQISLAKKTCACYTSTWLYFARKISIRFFFWHIFVFITSSLVLKAPLQKFKFLCCGTQPWHWAEITQNSASKRRGQGGHHSCCPMQNKLLCPGPDVSCCGLQSCVHCTTGVCISWIPTPSMFCWL